MGSSAKRKKEKKKDFQKPKLKVGKTRPKNTNATDTSFSAKSIVFKQQNLTEAPRDLQALFEHNLSLLTSKTETQRRDALRFLTATIASAASSAQPLPQPHSLVVSKAQPLLLDRSTQVREQLLRLLRAIPGAHLAPLIDQLLLYTRAGMTHLSSSIRSSSLDVLDLLLASNADALLSCAGGWVKTLRTFQNLLSWHGGPTSTSPTAAGGGKWTSTKPAAAAATTTQTTTTTLDPSSTKLLVHQLTTLARLLAAGLARPSSSREHAAAAAAARRAALLFPLVHPDASTLLPAPRRSHGAFGHMNLFGAPRDVDGELYDSPDERAEVLVAEGIYDTLRLGAAEARREAGEIGRAAAAVEKSLRLVEGAGG